MHIISGVLRADDFDAMLLRHPTERGIAIDHWAALVIDQGHYRIISVPNKTGSVILPPSSPESSSVSAEFSREAAGVPGIWIKEVVSGEVVRRLPRLAGPLDELIARTNPLDSITQDPRVEAVRQANPQLE